METEPVDRIEDHQSGETPEDVAILYSWANLQGAKYRDFSANRREYRAQMRHRAAEQLRLMELKAQSEAEAAAAEAESEAAAAHAEADAATVRLAASRIMPGSAPEAIQAEEEVEHQRRSSLREATQQARRAAAERLEAARRAEAAALADSIARREEREIAEAQASALRQAAQYADSDLRNRQMNSMQPDDAVPGRISDPYSPQILAEGEYFENPGTPITELEASRFRTQREYIERATGAELPPFRMPRGFREDQVSERPPYRQPDPDEGSSSDWHDEEVSFEREGDFAPRKISDLNREGRDIHPRNEVWRDRDHENGAPGFPLRPLSDAPRLHALREATPHTPGPIPLVRPQQGQQYTETEASRRRAEVVDRIPPARIPNPAGKFLYRGDHAGYGTDHNIFDDSQFPGDLHQAPRGTTPIFRDHAGPSYPPNGQSDLQQGNPREIRLAPDRAAFAGVEPSHRQADNPGRDHWRGRGTQFDGYSEGNFDLPASYPASEPLYRPMQSPARPVRRENEQAAARSQSPRPPFADDFENDAVGVPAGGARFRSPSERSPYPLENDPPPQASSDRTDPEWLGLKAASLGAQRSAPQAAPGLRDEPRDEGETLQSSREQIASRWFALKEIFAQTGRRSSPAPQVIKETKRKAPIIAVFSIAGGVGKTSLVATLGRTLSSLGEKVLLADTTSHELLPFYFGATERMPGVVRTFLPPSGSSDAPIHLVSYGADLQSDGAGQGEIVAELVADSPRAHRVLVDLDKNSTWLVERVAKQQLTMLVPLSADMNSIISLQTVERSVSGILDAEGEPLRPLYLLNRFDPSLPLHLDVREVLRQQLGDRLLPFVIRQAKGVSEALAEGMTVVDYDPESVVAQDYLALANWIRAKSAPAAVGFRDLRWSER